jgi:hypothetical protein
VRVSVRSQELAEAERIVDTRERETAVKQAREDYQSGRMVLRYPDVLTARYRLMWDEDGKLVADPEQRYEPGSTTAGGLRYCYESTNLEDVRKKVRDLKLRYTPDNSIDEREAQ